MGKSQQYKSIGGDWGGPNPAFAAGAFVFVLTLFAIVFLSQKLWLFFPDDAFFYMKTAHNIGRGEMMSFDGVNPTNGFHPLYLFLLSAVSSVFPVKGITGLKIVFVVDGLLTIAWFFVVVAASRAMGHTKLVTSLFVAAIVPIALHQDFGTEAGLALVLAWGYFLAVFRYDGSLSSLLVIVLLGCLVCLARLDAITFVLAVTFASVVSGFLSGKLTILSAAGRALLFVGPAFLTIAGLGLINSAFYGHSSTISSWLKAGFRWLEIEEGVALFEIDPVGMLPLSVPLLIGFVFAGVAVLRMLLRPTQRNVFVASIGIWLIGYIAIMTFFLRGGMETWYYTLPFSVVVLLGIDLLASPLSRLAHTSGRLLIAVFVAGSVIMTSGLAYYWLSRESGMYPAMATSIWIRDNLPQDARIYQIDWSGVTGYFSDRAIINGDGLVNSWEYQDMVRSGRIAEYFEKYSIEYALDDNFKGGETYEAHLPLWNERPLVFGLKGEPERLFEFLPFLLVKVEEGAPYTRPAVEE